MKRVLCYGDSITWGCNPDDGGRFDENTRYPCVLQTLLGADYRVIEEGCGGRTTVYDSDVDHYVNGRTYLYPCLHSHQPLDLIVLMLGTNDVANGAHKNAYYAAAGAERLIHEIRHWSMDQRAACPKILLLSPPLISLHLSPDMDQVFDLQYAHEQSLLFRKYYQEVAERCGCGFLAAQAYAQAGSDGVHISAESHRRLAQAISEQVKDMLREEPR